MFLAKDDVRNDEVTWHLASGDFTWLCGHLTEINSNEKEGLIVKISKLYLWLSLAIAMLVLFASSIGLLHNSIYARETISWTVQSNGQDIANFVYIAVLLIAAYFINKASFKAFLAWIGVLLSLLYAYVLYAFDTHFNSLFLVYVAILGLSFYTLLGSSMQMHRDSLQNYFTTNSKARLVSIFLLVVAILFYFLWLSEDMPAVLTGKPPHSVSEAGLLTNPVHVLDLAFYLPGMIITATLLWRRKLLGYILAIPFLVFIILTGIGILAIFFTMSSNAMSTNPGVEFFIALIILISFVQSVLFLREVN